MPFVIAAPCIDVLDQACVRVCPVACIHFEAGKDRKLYIDPNECIDCGACEPACPVEAIYSELDLPTRWMQYADIDALYQQQAVETDRDKREALLHQIQRLLHERVRYAAIWEYIWPSGIGPRILITL